jgi:tetratricopeptide (TPR) repeat protein
MDSTPSRPAGRAVTVHRGGMKMAPTRSRTIIITILALSAVALAAVASCSGNDAGTLYQAEKALFKARSLREKIAAAVNKEEFIDKTIQSYRDVVDRYGQSIETVKGLEEIVVSAQMDLAQLEFQAGRLENARSDFERAYGLARAIPEARANARYSVAVISGELGDIQGAASSFEQFYAEFLGEATLCKTAGWNGTYALAPLKLFEISQSLGEDRTARLWLDKAEKTYLYIIENGTNPSLEREMRFNLLTTYLQGARWDESLKTIKELRELYTGSPDAASLLYLEGKVHEDGLSDGARALTLYEQVYTRYPRSNEARVAMLAAAALHMKAGRTEKARSLYQSLIDTYPGAVNEVAEATWQLAQLTERDGDWLDASLLYTSLYTSYPETLQGLEAPLHIAERFKTNGESAAARASYQKAIEHYRGLISKQVDLEVKIIAEKHIVRAMTEQEEWAAAADRLLELPALYPYYTRFRGNYLMAASIYERELNDADRAAEILRRCIEEYPETDIAVEAEAQLKRIKGM